jgi:hypothetical protein
VAKVIKYGDFTKVEATGFKPAPVGLYYAKVESIKQTTSQKNNEEMVEVVFRLTKDSDGKKLKEQYGQLWYYAPLDPNSSWARRFKELVTAFGLKPKSGNVAVIEGKEAMVRLREDTDLNGGYRPTIGKVIALPDEAEAEEEDEEDEAEDSNGLADLSRAELKKLIKDEELEVRVTKSMSDDDLRAAIAEVREDEEEDEEEEEEPEDEADEDEEDDDESEDEDEEESDNYEAMSVAELRQELKDRELATNGKRTVLIARLRTDDVEEPV